MKKATRNDGIVVSSMFVCLCRQVPVKHRPTIRVLSLFDGIGTGKVALDGLGFNVEVYYASETDSNATLVSQLRHHGTITHVGDVCNVTATRVLIITIHTHACTVVLLLFWNLSGTTRVSRYQKGKTNLDLVEQEIVIGNGICWAICKSAPHPR